MQEKTPPRLVLFASCADHGTASITARYKKVLAPDVSFEVNKGFTKMGPASLLRSIALLASWRKERARVICLFNAPILLASLVARGQMSSWRGVLDWTQAYPTTQIGQDMTLYNKAYLASFRSLGAALSPSAGFRHYYQGLGANIGSTMYPLPCEPFENITPNVSGYPKVLFIGADYKRKGGHLLLDYWVKHQPRASLSFVSPDPPKACVTSVAFRRDIVTGSSEHTELFRQHDILVLPTSNEPFGYVVLEALCNGLVVVTTNCAGSSSIVAESGGFVGRTPQHAIELLDSLIKHPSRVVRAKWDVLRYLPALVTRTQSAIESLIRE